MVHRCRRQTGLRVLMRSLDGWNGSMHGWMDGMDRCMDGWMDGLMDGPSWQARCTPIRISSMQLPRATIRCSSKELHTCEWRKVAREKHCSARCDRTPLTHSDRRQGRSRLDRFDFDMFPYFGFGIASILRLPNTRWTELVT